MRSGLPGDAMPEITTPAAHPSSASKRFSAWWSTARTSLLWMFLIAFGLRVGTIIVFHTYKFKTADAHFSIGWEMGRIGEALASGRGFSDPFQGHTGPTAWEPPLYPYLIAGVFKVFGIYTHASAFVLLTLSSLFSALTCIPIFLVGRRCFGEKVAVASAWTWAVLPYVMFWSTKVVWETSLSALLYTILFWLTLTMEDRDGWWPWIEYGLLWGIAGLNSTVLLAFLPASGLWIWYRRYKRKRGSIAGLVLAAALFMALMTPWTIRNYRTFGKLILGRDNFGAELRMGNGPWADGTWMVYLHPTQNIYALHQYQQMGELAYIAMRKQQAMDFIREDRGRFIWLCIKRFIYFWQGVPKGSEIWWLAQTKNSLFLASSVLMFWGLGRAIRKKKPGAWLFFWILLLYPFVYYIVFPYPRYRHPVEPEIVILGIFLISEAEIHGKPIGER
jgi:4-amino-4-deoxy-L-arabinose transferase-like glycosyltransferase